MNTRMTTKGGVAGGFSLVEMMIAVAILSVVLASLGMFELANDRAYRTGTIAAHLEAQAAATIEGIVVELSTVGLETVAPDPLPGVGSETIQYLQASGINGGAIEWTPLRRLSLEYEDREINDGLDNNKNGLIDEGRIVLTEDVGGPGERSRVLTRWVRELFDGEEANGVDDNANGLIDERGFFLERTGETLVVRLTLQKLSAEGRLMSRTARTSVRLRN